MKQDIKQGVDKQRREFMRDSLSTSVAVAVAASLPATALAVEETTTEVKKQQGYHLTSHILEYYRSAAS